MELFETPVLFLIFNRPDLTETVFRRIREVRPKYLYVAADGPRTTHSEDVDKCKSTRQVVLDLIDWDCEVKTLFRDENLGCGRAVSGAITWFFEHVEEGIILEDDCLPDLSFFRFCQMMLSEYIDDKRIMMISGYNICNEWKSKYQSYHFSFFGGVWCWATWKRAWRLYDFDIKLWEDEELKNLLLNRYFSDFKKKRAKIYDDLYQKKIDTWDLQWGFCRIVNSGLSIIPSKNLILNLGFRDDSTHTKRKPNWYTSNLNNISVPRFHQFVIPDIEYDKVHLSLTHSRNSKIKLKKFKL